MTHNRAVVGLVLLFACSVSFPKAYGDDGGLDIVLTIDTSGSMKKTDPDNLRVEACKLFLSLLAAGNRVALVTFDSSSRTLAPMIPLGENRNYMLDRLKRVSSEGPYTDLYKAIFHASEILRKPSKAKRAILLMTDGRMDVGDRSSERELSARLMDTLIPELKRREIEIYTIAFTQESDFDFLKRVALQSGGFFYLAEEDRDLHLTFTNIYDRLAVPDTIPVQGDEFYVDRSVREINVVVSKADPETNVVLLLPDRKSQTYQEHSSDVQWFQSQAFEMITVPRPMPGPWRIGYGAERGNKVFILTDLRLLTNFAKSVLPFETETEIEVWLQQGPDTGEKNPLQIRDVQVTAEVEQVGGPRSPLSLRDDGTNGDREAGDGIYTGLLKAGRCGEYRLRVKADGMTFEREREHNYYVPEKAFVQTAAEGLEAEGVAEEQKASEEQPPAEGGEESPGEVEEGTSWVAVLGKFFLINVALAAAGMTFVLRRQGRLQFRKRNDDH